MKDHNLLPRKINVSLDSIELNIWAILLPRKGYPLFPIKQLRGFIGLTDYYRRFIQGFGIISKPLIYLLKKDSYKWSLAATDSFKQLKEVLTRTPVLALPDANKTFVVETDASAYGIGVVLMQQGHPIDFISKTLSPRHATLSVYDMEFLAIIHAVLNGLSIFLGKGSLSELIRGL